MSIIEWIVDAIVFFREIIAIFIVIFIWKFITGQTKWNRRNSAHRSYHNEQNYDYDDSSHINHQNYSSDEPLYQNHYEEQEQREYDSAGDFLVNGNMSDFDYENAYHRQAADSLDPYNSNNY
jgi:hypothetical protein